MGQLEELRLAKDAAIVEQAHGKEAARALMGIITAVFAEQREAQREELRALHEEIRAETDKSEARHKEWLAAFEARTDKTLDLLRADIKRANRNDWWRLGILTIGFVLSSAGIVFAAIRALHP